VLIFKTNPSGVKRFWKNFLKEKKLVLCKLTTRLEHVTEIARNPMGKTLKSFAEKLLKKNE
jgi:hypothetical protein